MSKKKSTYQEFWEALNKRPQRKLKETFEGCKACAGRSKHEQMLCYKCNGRNLDV